jgi:hypothetical protein
LSSSSIFFFSFVVAQKSNLGLCHPIFYTSTPHTVAHTHLVGLLWMSNQLITEAATYTTYNQHKRQTSKPSVGFKPVIPAVK